MSSRAAAIEAARSLARVLSSLPSAENVSRALSGITWSRPSSEGRPDPYMLKMLRFLSDRIVSIREREDPWSAPEFRLFSEAFMLSGEFQEAVKRGVALVKLRPGSAALDLHSGPGVCLELIGSQWSKLIAVDPSPYNLELVEERLRGIRVSNYELLLGDCEKVASLVRDPVGLAIAASPVNWFYDINFIVNRLYATVEPGGSVLLVAPVEKAGEVNPLLPFILALKGRAPPSRERLEDTLLSEGFARVRVREGELLSTVVAVKP